MRMLGDGDDVIDGYRWVGDDADTERERGRLGDRRGNKSKCEVVVVVTGEMVGVVTSCFSFGCFLGARDPCSFWFDCLLEA